MARPPHVSDADWTDWRWQMRHRVHDEAGLCAYVEPTADELGSHRGDA